MFNIDLPAIIEWLLPTWLRGSFTKAFLNSLVVTLQNLHNNLEDYRILKEYELSINGQVIWLEKMLNDRYDPSSQQIYIEDVGLVEQVYLNNKSENPRPPYIYNKAHPGTPTYLRNRSEDVYQFNFTVWVPISIYTGLLDNNETELKAMKALINKYKMFGTIYIIQSF